MVEKQREPRSGGNGRVRRAGEFKLMKMRCYMCELPKTNVIILFCRHMNKPTKNVSKNTEKRKI